MLAYIPAPWIRHGSVDHFQRKNQPDFHSCFFAIVCRPNPRIHRVSTKKPCSWLRFCTRFGDSPFSDTPRYHVVFHMIPFSSHILLRKSTCLWWNHHFQTQQGSIDAWNCNVYGFKLGVSCLFFGVRGKFMLNTIPICFTYDICSTYKNPTWPIKKQPNCLFFSPNVKHLGHSRAVNEQLDLKTTAEKEASAKKVERDGEGIGMGKPIKMVMIGGWFMTLFYMFYPHKSLFSDTPRRIPSGKR